MIESAEEFVRLRRSPIPDDYRRAAHEEAPFHVWVDIVDRFPEMRPWVAHNKSVPLEILGVLAADRDAEVRAAVADKRKLTGELFHLLAADLDEGVRSRIAYNAMAPVELLETLSADPAELVRHAAQTALAHRRRAR